MLCRAYRSQTCAVYNGNVRAVSPIYSGVSVNSKTDMWGGSPIFDMYVQSGLSVICNIHLPDVYNPVRIIRKIALYLRERPVPPLCGQTGVRRVSRELSERVCFCGCVTVQNCPVVVNEVDLLLCAAPAAHVDCYRGISINTV